MQLFHSEGVILEAFDFKDYDQIIRVFTLNEGVISLISKGSRRKKNLTLSPLLRAEFVYSKGKSDLFLCREISPLNFYLNLRNKWASLQTASKLILAIKNTQLAPKPAPHLYELFIHFLNIIHKYENYNALEASFYLKTLKHEGLFGETLDEISSSPLPFSEEEARKMIELSQCLSFQTLEKYTVSSALLEKIFLYFTYLH